MHWLIRYYNQNRQKIWIIIASVVFIIIIIQVLDELAKNQKNNTNQSSSITGQSSIQSNYNYSIMSDKQVSTSVSNSNNQLVEQFIEYCNVGNTENAYSLLTNECKELLYPTLQDFINGYHSQVFKTIKTYSMQNWYSEETNTYKLRILDDMLSTGSYNNSEIIEDYFTIIETEEGAKLNINGYIGRTQINKKATENGVGINIISKDMYMDYEIYNIQVENNTEKTIMLDSKEKSTSSYLTGENNAEFSAYMFELADQDLIIEKGSNNTIKIKYNKMYNPEIEIESITFSDIIIDYQEYQNTKNKKEYINRTNVTIDIAR